ncbi:LysR family transcriptional regulator [Mycobacterium sp. URHB0021]
MNPTQPNSEGPMEIRDLRVFVAVAEEGGLSSAARRLHMSQSSLSQIIQSLEKQLGCRLLDRDHTGARPTEQGSFLLQEARSLVAHHDRVVTEITDLAAAGASPLRIGVPLELPADLLPSAIARVSAIFSDLVVQLRHARSTDQLAALLLGELDMALLRDRPSHRQIDSVLAVQESMGVILTAERAEELAQPAGVPLHHLGALRWVGFSRGDAPAWHDQVTATLRGHGITGIDWVVEQDQPVTPEVKLAAAGTGHAFALAPQGWARPLPDGLVWHRLLGDPLIRRTWAAWQTESRRRELAHLIADLDLSSRTVGDVDGE